MPPSQRTDGAATRLAAPADASDVAQLLHDFQIEYSEPTPEVEELTGRYRRQLEAGEMTVILVGEGPEGFAQLRFRPWVYTDGLHAYLEELYVVPASRGHGLGRALLEAAMETARSKGAEQMELGTSEDDVAARNLYESVGFTNREGRPEGPMMLFYEREL